ncbi:helix-turn-helix domain-containing protein [Streptacidiphilus sp. MAP12-20]|uniref:helix-turn-helix domain-containing protein n=1 Tax=Streptacidiphilus sp. MAP12-20 TaxID=3156299 RepID=UPI003518DAEF
MAPRAVPRGRPGRGPRDGGRAGPDLSSGALAALLDPLAERPELLATLRAYLARQQDRRGTARELGLHPNTVDNRLARASELIGVDVTSPRGYALALTALTLRELRPPEPG